MCSNPVKIYFNSQKNEKQAIQTEMKKKTNILTQYDLEILICYFCAEEWWEEDIKSLCFYNWAIILLQEQKPLYEQLKTLQFMTYNSPFKL